MSNIKQTGYAPVNGINMYYEIYGEGEIPLVLIHGGGSTIQSTFSKLIPLLSDYGKLIGVELQAHGRTSDRDAPESFTQDADDVAALLKHLNINRANIMGFSNGGSTALQVAIRHPQLVNKIIAISAAFKRDGLMAGFFEGMAHATLDNMPEGLKEAYLEVNNDHAGLLNMFNKDRERMINFTDWDENDLKGIKVPAMIMGSDRDVIVNEHTLEIARLIENSKMVILPGFHGGLIGEAGSAESTLPQATALIIKDFLS